MKGAEVPWVAIVVILAILVLAIGLYLLMSSGFEQTGEIRNFREFCLYWSFHRYREGFGENIQIGNYSVSVEDQCRKQLGKPIEFFSELNENDLENCRNACKLVRNESAN